MKIEDYSQIPQKFFDLDIRAEQIIHLASQCSLELLPHEVEEAFNSDWDEIWEVLGLNNPSDDIEDNLWRLALRKKHGFLVKMAMPVVISEGVSHGWGCYTARWLYSDKLLDVYAAAIEWRKQYLEKNGV